MKKTKVKTRNSALKRFKITKTGKVLRRQGSSRHLRTKKSKSKKRAQKRLLPVTKSYAKKIRKALGVRKAK